MAGTSAFISGLFALSGAVIGQILNNILTLKRENKKYNKEVYQELFAPILSDLFAYSDITLHFRKLSEIKVEINEEDYINRAINIIEKNLKYASPKLISAYQSFSRTEYLEDYAGHTHFSIRLNLVEVCLNDAYNVVKNNKIMENDQLDTLNYYRIIYKTWIMVINNIKDTSVAHYVMIHFWIFDRTKLNETFYNRLLARFETVKDEYFPTVFEDEFSDLIHDENNSKIFNEEIMGAIRQESEKVKSAHEYNYFIYEFNKDLKNGG